MTPALARLTDEVSDLLVSAEVWRSVEVADLVTGGHVVAPAAPVDRVDARRQDQAAAHAALTRVPGGGPVPWPVVLHDLGAAGSTPDPAGPLYEVVAGGWLVRAAHDWLAGRSLIPAMYVPGAFVDPEMPQVPVADPAGRRLPPTWWVGYGHLTHAGRAWWSTRARVVVVTVVAEAGPARDRVVAAARECEGHGLRSAA